MNGGGEETSASVRVRLDLAYDGRLFHGWAAQPGLRTVEGELTAALSTLARTSVRLTVAGRTDAGVHAQHQVAHVDVPLTSWEGLPGRSAGHRSPEEALVSRLNGLLARSMQVPVTSFTAPAGDPRSGSGVAPSALAGATGAGSSGSVTGARDTAVAPPGWPSAPRGTSDVVVHRATVVTRDFDARFSAVGRHYVYRLSDRMDTRDPLRRSDVVWLPTGPLDLVAMQEAAQPLLGEHDFLSFCRPRAGATTIRTLRELRFSDEGGVVRVDVAADAFCHSMVRSLVGASVEVGLGRRPVTWPQHLLSQRSRQGAAPVAPAHGLTLVRVDYPPREQWASRAREAAHRREECC